MTSLTPAAAIRAGSRPKARTVSPARARRGINSAPIAPLAPVTRACTTVQGTRRSRDWRLPWPVVERYDLAIVGAGIIGLATARELLARRPGLRVAVVDAADEVGTGQTGHNSGVIHAGIYYKPGSLKARMCVDGAARLYDYCEQRGIAVERCGKVIVALHEGELARLDELERRGRANAVPGLRRLRAEEIAELEPHCAGIAGLHSPNTGIVDFGAVARAMADDVRAAGGELALGRAVTGVSRDNGAVRLEGAEVTARHAIFCAGGQASRLAVAAGAPQDPRIVPFRGQYLSLRPHARGLVKGLIYPV